MRKYEAMRAIETIYGTVHEGSIPAWMEVVLVTTFFGQTFYKYFFGQIYINKQIAKLTKDIAVCKKYPGFTIDPSNKKIKTYYKIFGLEQYGSYTIGFKIIIIIEQTMKIVTYDNSLKTDNTKKIILT